MLLEVCRRGSVSFCKEDDDLSTILAAWRVMGTQ